MRLCLRLVNLVFMCICLQQAAPAFAQNEAVHGTRVSMVKPAGFSAAPNFSGFQNRETGSSIMVTEVPAPFAEATAGFTAERMASKGMKLISRQSTKVGAYPALLLSISQAAYGAVFKKWMLVFGDASFTIIATATFPEEHEETMSTVLKNAVLSTSLRASGAAPPSQADLTYSLPATAEMKLAGRVQNLLLFTPEGKMVSPDKFMTMFIVGQSFSELTVGDKSDYARRRLEKTASVRDIRIKDEHDVTIAGLPGRELVGTAIDTKWGVPVLLYQTMLFGEKTYYVMQGQADINAAAKYEPLFKSMARSFKTKRAELN